MGDIDKPEINGGDRDSISIDDPNWAKMKETSGYLAIPPLTPKDLQKPEVMREEIDGLRDAGIVVTAFLPAVDIVGIAAGVGKAAQMVGDSRIVSTAFKAVQAAGRVVGIGGKTAETLTEDAATVLTDAGKDESVIGKYVQFGRRKNSGEVPEYREPEYTEPKYTEPKYRDPKYVQTSDTHEQIMDKLAGDNPDARKAIEVLQRGLREERAATAKYNPEIAIMDLSRLEIPAEKIGQMYVEAGGNVDRLLVSIRDLAKPRGGDFITNDPF